MIFQISKGFFLAFVPQHGEQKVQFFFGLGMHPVSLIAADEILIGRGTGIILSLINHAELVITNSFHAVSFSAIMQTKFWVFAHAKGKSTSSRIYSITERLGLENRVLNRSNSDSINPLEEIDFTKVETKIEDMVKSSKEFLLNNIED